MADNDHGQSSSKDSNRRERPLPDPALKWGITPSKKYDPDKKPGPEHPVHKIPLEKQEKMRRKGIDPVLRAEMDEAVKGGGFWRKVAQTSMGGGWIK
ncbi:hypothetical protein N7457_006459 [Penicillium paradoxum]|uniref:uncharacterized protein n=1 Tax=Penicillium paradoxum TaxID=176176 RepID=UPI002546BB0B|nr:uncharacterized protein N7457_006459 [Penicillium paradoxum]KAJ5781299.1 hypothetical protein N7457_006459 [Penicillium paradoxum]